MDRRAAEDGRIGAAGAALIVVAVLVRLLILPLAPGLLAAEGCITLLAVAFAAASFRMGRGRARSAFAVLYSLTPALLAALGLRLAATSLPDYPLFAVLVFAALVLSIDLSGRRSTVLTAGGVVLVVFAALWLTTLPLVTNSFAALGFSVAVLLGLLLLAMMHASRVRRLGDADFRQGTVFAALSRRLGVARDVGAVSAAILEVCRGIYPFTTYGAVLLLDETDGLLKPTGVQLGPDGIEAPVAVELAPGEGLSGAAFLAAGPQLWPTAVDVSTAQSTLREANRARIRQSQPGFARCAVAAPMRLEDGEPMGVLVLICRRRENAWSSQDLPTVAALALEAARAVERARHHAADVDRALLDSITGLVTHRQLVTVVDKEVARAGRAGESVGVIFSDLDGFKQVNDAWGHDAGNRVLRLFADVLRGTLRREDTAARYGGDEFVCVLPGAERAQALAIAERIQQRFAEVAASDPASPSNISVSSGVAVFPLDAGTAEGLLAAADAELLRAKHRRRAEADNELTGRREPRVTSPST